MTTTLLSLWLGAAALSVGQPAPPTHFVDQDGQQHSLQQLLTKGCVALAFYPKAFTSGCTKEMQTFARRIKALRSKGVEVLAISGDDAATLQRFKKELAADFIFVPDSDAKLMELYGVRAWPLKMARRVTFVVNRQGKIARIDRGEQAIGADAVADFLLQP